MESAIQHNGVLLASNTLANWASEFNSDNEPSALLAVFVHMSFFPLQVSVLVMCHTRELAFQISKEYERFSKYMSAVKVRGFPLW